MGKRIDLTGQRFGKLLVIEEGSFKNGKLYWKCKCDCGNEKEIYGYSLRCGKTTSCGQCKREYNLKEEDNLVGQTFNNLTVIEYEGPRQAPGGKIRRFWKCKCSCGNICSVSTTDLKDGSKKSCGCLLQQYQQFGKAKDITNQRFGKLIAIKPDYEKSKNRHGIIWECKCDCGNTCYTETTNLLQGKTKSCGCLLKEILLERSANNREVKIGNIYGFLQVTGDAGSENGRHYSICKCLNCNKENIRVKDNSLQSGKIKSCGCMRSCGENKIQELLTQNNILYNKEYKPENLSIDTDLDGRFDFAIFNQDNTKLKYLIEYDGIQHFQTTGGWNTEEKLKVTQEHDQIKNQWCKDNDIILIRIPYTKYNTLCIEDLLPETSSFKI